jgi:hypothetical protein
VNQFTCALRCVRTVALLRVRREHQATTCAAEQRDQLATSEMIELHSIPASNERIGGIELAANSQRL